MQTMNMQRIASGRSASTIRPHSARAASRRCLVVKAQADIAEKPTSSLATTKLSYPEWVPAGAAPVLDFFTKDDFKLQDSDLYKKYMQPYAESDYFDLFTGFKPIPETINGRAAMLGFLAAAGAEVCGTGSFLAQLSQCPQPFLVVLALTIAGSAAPIIKGTQGGYLESLRETYTLPEGVFTEAMEKFHGRLAMVGLAGLLSIELLKGTPLL